MDQILLFSGPLVIGAVIGAWTTTGRLFVARLEGVQLPRWVPWAIGLLGVVVGLVMVGTQIITTTMGSATGSVATPAMHRTAAAMIGMLLSPAWVMGASLAVLGVLLHYVLDEFLKVLKLHEITYEGLSQGIRASWATISLLALFFGLQNTYNTVSTQFHATIDFVLLQAGAYQLVMNILTLLIALLGMVAPLLIEPTENTPIARKPPATVE
jgi:hypothetical protein